MALLRCARGLFGLQTRAAVDLTFGALAPRFARAYSADLGEKRTGRVRPPPNRGIALESDTRRREGGKYLWAFDGELKGMRASRAAAMSPRRGHL